MRVRKGAVMLFGAIGIASCGEQPTAPELAAGSGPELQRFERGTGLVLDNVTSTPIPLLGDVVLQGDVVITELALNAVGGLEATGTITGTVDALGIPIEESFVTDVAVSRTGSGGQCGLLTLNLAPINVDVAGEIVSVDLTDATIAAKASGPVGTLLCLVTGLLDSAVGGAVNGLLNALNGLLGGGGGGPPLPPVLP